MAASLFQAGKIDKVFVGADRIAVNGDSANKIGTYSVAVLAKFHNVPFYIVAPETTLDPKCPSAAQIPIEERGASEVRGLNSPQNAPVWNPAFDITPRNLITKILLDSGER
jgi:methylthioribose-1-phosphate isomerase